jgi:hypothetical protein
MLGLMPTAFAQRGIEFTGRWTGPTDAPIASYGGSAVVLKFKGSTSVTADLTIGPGDPEGDPANKVWIAVSVDGGVPQRRGLARGPHNGYHIIDGISLGPHTVEVRDDSEPDFGSLQFANARLEARGTWAEIQDSRSIIEVIDDSGATGLCVLGPQSPAGHVTLFTSEWESQALSWPGLLESSLAAIGRPAIVVDLALTGSDTRSEAETYDLAAPRAFPPFDKQKFATYSDSRHASLILLLGGSNDRSFGGDIATGSPVTPDNLSPFQRGVYDQIAKIVALNPKAKIGLLHYDDPIVPDWTPAYLQVLGLLSKDIRQRVYSLGVKDSPSDWTACAASPDGHPNLAMHAAFAAQITQWIIANGLLAKP